ncbi:MAG: beta-propeller fold lactonase family protein [Vicinamibacterales bacterium]
MKNRAMFVAVAVTALLVVGAGHDSVRAERSSGAVYTMSNATTGNRILAFERGPGGTLTHTGSFATGGLGSGGGLGSQGALTLSENDRWLLAVNAGSNDVTLFATDDDGLRWLDKVPSGGTQPVSVTIHRTLVYVLNAGSDSVSGFRLRPHGQLSPIAGSTRPLSGSATGPAQVQFSPDGRVLVVTEKATNLILTYVVDEEGFLGPPQVQPSHGATPFGFAFGIRRQLFVSEAFGGAPDASAVSSYGVAANGTLHLVSPTVATHQTAACWVVVTEGGRFAYTTNTGSGSISGYGIDQDGTLTPLNADGRTADTGAGSAPTDLALSENGRFLFVLNSAAHSIGTFRIRRNGQLEPVGTIGGLPVGANGLAAQ